MHTPGPWYIEHPYDEPGTYIGGPNTELVAKVYNEDDAALIAAAPDLLRSLEFLTTAAELEPAMSIYRAHIQQAKELIALVKGN